MEKNKSASNEKKMFSFVSNEFPTMECFICYIRKKVKIDNIFKALSHSDSTLVIMKKQKTLQFLLLPRILVINK